MHTHPAQPNPPQSLSSSAHEAQLAEAEDLQAAADFALCTLQITESEREQMWAIADRLIASARAGIRDTAVLA